MLATADVGIKHFLSAVSILEACLPTPPSLSSLPCPLLQFLGPQSLGAPPDCLLGLVRNMIFRVFFSLLFLGP